MKYTDIRHEGSLQKGKLFGQESFVTEEMGQVTKLITLWGFSLKKTHHMQTGKGSLYPRVNHLCSGLSDRLVEVAQE